MLRLTILSLGMASVIASAPCQATEAEKIAHACAGAQAVDVAGVPPGQGRIKACMKAHVTELSAPCFDAIMGAVAAGKE